VIIGISAAVCIITTLSLSAISTNGEVKGGNVCPKPCEKTPNGTVFRRNILHYIEIIGSRIRRFSRHRVRFRQRRFRLDEHDRFLQLPQRSAEDIRPEDHRCWDQRRQNHRRRCHIRHDPDLCGRDGMGVQSAELPDRGDRGSHRGLSRGGDHRAT
jgi:hypothetical protein